MIKAEIILAILGLVAFIASMILLWSVDWRIMIGVSLFGFSLNVGNKIN